MQLIRGIHNLQHHYGECVLTIGNFDGFHRGHRALLSALQIESHRRDLPVTMIIFEPHPQEYFAGSAAPARLTQLRDKIKYLAAAGVDKVLCVTFNARFAALSAHTFVSDLLVQRLKVRFVLVGDDFRFGSQRQGDFSLLLQAGKKAGFEVMNTITYTEHGRRISSTAVREALAQDLLVEAEVLLGHPYRISGRVAHGDARGKIIGFPTANVSLKKKSPINGVYAVEVYGISVQPLLGVANIGTRPTVSGLSQWLEVHLLDVTMNLYGRHIEVVIRAKVRNEQRFASLSELTRQIANDVVNVRNYFSWRQLNKIRTKNKI